MKSKPGSAAKARKPRPKFHVPDDAEDTTHATSRIDVGANYTPDELEFLKAVEAWKRRTRRQFPTCVDYLRIALELGYAKR